MLAVVGVEYYDVEKMDVYNISKNFHNMGAISNDVIYYLAWQYTEGRNPLTHK